MTISQLEAEPARGNPERSSFLESGPKETSPSTGTKRNPPARNTSRFWFERFLAVIQRQNPTVIDASFLSQIAPSNEGKLLAQLKFLGVIDEQGKPTRLLPQLNMVGEEQKKAFQEIASEAYRELQSEVKMEKAVPDDLINFFIRKYTFTRDKGINASRFYLYLIEKSGGPISGELGTFLTEKPSSVPSGSVSPSTARITPPAVRTLNRDARLNEGSTSRHHIPNRRGRAAYVEERSPFQAVINIKLEKDTPKEYWDRVLALLGEKPMSGERESEGESLDQEPDTDASAFT
jgi:hypothetical protein